jgi:hypothetical protein
MSKWNCEKFIDLFVLFCIIAALVSFLYTKSNYKWFPGQKSTVRGFGTGGDPTNVSAKIGIAASNFSGGGVTLPVEPFTTFTKWGDPTPYNSRRELTLKQAF